MEAGARERLSAAVVSRVRSFPAWSTASSILAFHPMPEEVDVTPLLEETVHRLGVVWLPRIHEGELVFHAVGSLERDTTPRTFGILEPRRELPRFDAANHPGGILVLTPGLAFDRSGRRLGRGKGYYDRWLQALRAAAPGRVCALAVAFSFQVLEVVPAGERDQSVDVVATDRETITASAIEGLR